MYIFRIIFIINFNETFKIDTPGKHGIALGR